MLLRILLHNARHALTYNGLAVVSGDGEHHNAADATLDFLINRGRIHSLRLHPHAEADKKATPGNFAASDAGLTMEGGDRSGECLHS